MLQKKYIISLIFIINLVGSSSFLCCFSLSSAICLLPRAEAKSNRKRKTDNEKNKNEKKKRNNQKKNKNHEAYKKTSHSYLGTILEHKKRNIIAELAMYFVKDKLLKNNVPAEVIAKITPKITEVIKETKDIHKQISQEMTTLQERKKQLNSLFYKSPEVIKELRQLNETEKKLLEKANVLGTAITSAAQLYDRQAGGNTAQQITEVVTTALELSENKYGQVASKIVAIASVVITSINDESHIEPLNSDTKYYPLRFENDKGGWLFGHDTSTGQVYLVFNRCNQQEGVNAWVTEHQEIIMESAYQFNLIDNEVARIITGDYQLGSKITVSTQYKYH